MGLMRQTASLHQGQPVLTAGAPLAGPRPAAAAMVMLHGRRASAENILTLAAELDRPGFAYLAPQAAGSSWYPHSFLAPLEQNEPWLSSALARVAAIVGDLEAAGIPAESTVLLGFSQGACLALEFARRQPRRFGGVVGLSGGLIGPSLDWDVAGPGGPVGPRLDSYAAGRGGLIGSLDAADVGPDGLIGPRLEADADGAPAGPLAGTPVFLGCSDRDPHIPAQRVEASARLLSQLGGRVTRRIYPGLGHAVNADEMAFVRQLLTEIPSA
jgi:phospholipase/carboxylesterase